jgi:hypothetical protein
MPRTITYDTGEHMTLHDNGQIERHDVPPPCSQPSGQWTVTGAVTLNNFGHTTRRWTLAEILADPAAIPWKHKNGSQRTHLTDLDHGTPRMQCSPGHTVR